MIIAPLTTIKLQLEDDCHKLGFSALVGDQVLPAGKFGITCEAALSYTPGGKGWEHPVFLKNT